MRKEIYLDHAATTQMWPQVQQAMEPYLCQKYMNASTRYMEGKKLRETVEKSREIIAEALDVDPKEIFFTSGGSEADNWAIKSIAGEYKKRGNHIVTDQIEHHAVLNSCKYLEELGYEVSYVAPCEDGYIEPQTVEQAIRLETTLVSVMYANNEIGTLEPVDEICRLAHQHGCLFHTDAVQAVGQVPLSMRWSDFDCLSASAHKFHGPKGVGFLYVRNTVDIPSFIHGGSQERGKRAGTENVAGIVGMAEALRLSVQQLEHQSSYVAGLRDYLSDRIREECAEVCFNGGDRRLPGNVNVSFRGVDADALLAMLDEAGICASAGSACNEGETKVSHVIRAIRVPADYALGTLRFSLGAENTRQELDYTVRILKESVELLREI